MGLTREVPAALLTALAGHFHPVLLIEADWPDGMIRLHTGVGKLTWGGYDWDGTSAVVDGRMISLVRFEIPEEAGGLPSTEALAHVAGRLEDVMAQRGKVIRNLAVLIRFGATTERAGTTLVSDPVDIFSGYYSERRFTFRMSGGDALHDMPLSLGTGPSARAKASITHGYEDQIAAYPGDTAGRQVQNAMKRALNPPVWPQ